MTTRIEETKFKIGRYLRPVKLVYKGNRIFVGFKYNKPLMAEIKAMEGARWHGFEDPPVKMWSISDTIRNQFQLEVLKNNNPHSKYDQPLVEFHSERPLYEHQIIQVKHILTYKQCIIAAEMGTGKTLSAIEVIEKISVKDFEAWYVGPKSGVRAVNLELEKWNSKVDPRMFTYERMTKKCKQWNNTEMLPRIVIFDESSKLKTPTSQRSEAALWLANNMRNEYGEETYIVEMSGTPAPKAPSDWWMQAEVACPGFLREGNVHKFKQRLCLIEQRESGITGGVYPHIVTWLDDKNKCAKCGALKDDEVHARFAQISGSGHEWEQSKNEVQYLYKRMKGLVLVQFKKDCLDLPDKRYELIIIKPTVEILHAAKLIVSTCTRGAMANTLLRELSDGFQYKTVEEGELTCPNCNGRGTKIIKVPKVDVDIMAPQNIDPENFIDKEVTCDNCGGAKVIPKYKRETQVVGSPKDEYFLRDLDNHEEVGRYIVWGGFTATIDRLVDMSLQRGWTVLRVDGRGYHSFSPTGIAPNPNDLLIGMDRKHPRSAELLEKYPRLCFVGHPEAGGMALTLTASPTELFYSNSFKGEARMQSEDRGHRIGMDENKGLTIKDFIMLPTDRKVLENLKQKKDLQNMSMGELRDAFKTG